MACRSDVESAYEHYKEALARREATHSMASLKEMYEKDTGKTLTDANYNDFVDYLENKGHGYNVYSRKGGAKNEAGEPQYIGPKQIGRLAADESDYIEKVSKKGEPARYKITEEHSKKLSPAGKTALTGLRGGKYADEGAPWNELKNVLANDMIGKDPNVRYYENWLDHARAYEAVSTKNDAQNLTQLRNYSNNNTGKRGDVARAAKDGTLQKEFRFAEMNDGSFHLMKSSESPPKGAVNTYPISDVGLMMSMSAFGSVPYLAALATSPLLPVLLFE